MFSAASENPGTGVRDRALVHFLWATGVRRAEVRGLDLGKLDVDERMAIILGKGNKERTVNFNEPCQQDLIQWLEVRPTWDPPEGVTQVFISARGMGCPAYRMAYRTWSRTVRLLREPSGRIHTGFFA
jgi:site-specific recombinase XerD